MMMDEIRECACHDSTSAIQQAVNTPKPKRVTPQAVTFAQFARAGRRLGWSLDFLVKIFRGKIDDPRDLIERIFDRHDRHGAMVIPYASVLTFYWRETAQKRRSGTVQKSPQDHRVSYIFSAQSGRGLPAGQSAPESTQADPDGESGTSRHSAPTP